MFSEVTNSAQLLRLLQNLYGGRYDVQVVPIDKLEEVERKGKQIIIINLNKRNQVGSHWLLIVMHEKHHVVYYDSMGYVKPHKTILDYLFGYMTDGLADNVIMGTVRNQPVKGKGSSACGWFIMKFLNEYIDKSKPVYEAVMDIKVRNTLSLARRLYKKFNLEHLA